MRSTSYYDLLTAGHSSGHAAFATGSSANISRPRAILCNTRETGAKSYASLLPNLSAGTNTGQKTKSPTCVVTLDQTCGLMANSSMLTLANRDPARSTRLLFQAGIRGTGQSRCRYFLALNPGGSGHIGSAFTRAVEWTGDSSCLSVSRSVFLSSAERMMRGRDATFCALLMAAVLAHSCVGGSHGAPQHHVP